MQLARGGFNSSPPISGAITCGERYLHPALRSECLAIMADARWNLPPDNRETNKSSSEMTRIIILGVISIILWQSPWGPYLLYPFTLLSTWFHEMGHGLAAELAGGDFVRLEIFSDGSGFALSEFSGDYSRFDRAFVAAAGLIGPSLAGGLLIIASRRTATVRAALVILGVALLLSSLIWVRSAAGLIVLPLLGVAILAIAKFASENVQRFTVQFLGVQGCISIFQSIGYLFSRGAVIDGQVSISDTEAMAEALFLPYWFWGAFVTCIIVAITWWCIRIVYRPRKR